MLLLCALYVVLSVFAAIISIRYYGMMKAPGWEARATDAGWIVTSIVPDGAAAGRLEPGDRLLALNGDKRAAVLGPPLLDNVPVDHTYRVDLARDGRQFSAELMLPIALLDVDNEITGWQTTVRPTFVVRWHTPVPYQRKTDDLCCNATIPASGGSRLVRMAGFVRAGRRSRPVIPWLAAVYPPLVVPAAEAGEGIADRADISVRVPKLYGHLYRHRRQVSYVSVG